MGAITRAIANNIGANGVLQAGAFANSSFGNVSAWPSTISAGNTVLISTTSISSNTTNVDITSGIDSTYPIYILKWINLSVQTDSANIQVDFSHNGGTSFAASKTTTYVRAYHQTSGSTGYSYETDKDLHDSSTAQRLSHSQANDADNGLCGIMWLINPSSTTYHTPFYGDGTFQQSDDTSFLYHFHGMVNSTNAVNAIRVNASSGDISGGKIKLYGFKDA